MNDQRWNDVRRRYAAMEDEELRRLRKDVDGLEDWARDLLRTEMQTRGLDWDQAGEEKPYEPALDPRFYSDAERAQIIALGGTNLHIAQGDLNLVQWVLEREGITSAIAPVNQYEGDVRVSPEDVERAQAIVDRISQQDREQHADAVEQTTLEDSCPKCKSEEIMVESVDDNGSHWLCDACGHQWSDADLVVEESA